VKVSIGMKKKIKKKIINTYFFSVDDVDGW
jgi:hypothetical protein